MTISIIQLVYLIGGGFVAMTTTGILGLLTFKEVRKTVKKAAKEGIREVK